MLMNQGNYIDGELIFLINEEFNNNNNNNY